MRIEQVDEALDSLRVITNETLMIVIGTQSLHGKYPDAPDDIMYSREVDVILKTRAALANWISNVVGDETPFEVERGYFIDHVRPKPGLPIFADGWEDRLIKRDAIANCTTLYLSPEDLVITKLGAGREKDIPFVVGMVNKGFISIRNVEDLIAKVPEEYRQKVVSSFALLVAELQPPVSLTSAWNAAPATSNHCGVIVAVSDFEVIQHIGQGRHVVWPKANLTGVPIEVGKVVDIGLDGQVQAATLARANNLGL